MRKRPLWPPKTLSGMGIPVRMRRAIGFRAMTRPTTRSRFTACRAAEAKRQGRGREHRAHDVVHAGGRHRRRAEATSAHRLNIARACGSARSFDRSDERIVCIGLPSAAAMRPATQWRWLSCAFVAAAALFRAGAALARAANVAMLTASLVLWGCRSPISTPEARRVQMQKRRFGAGRAPLPPLQAEPGAATASATNRAAPWRPDRWPRHSPATTAGSGATGPTRRRPPHCGRAMVSAKCVSADRHGDRAGDGLGAVFLPAMKRPGGSGKRCRLFRSVSM